MINSSDESIVLIMTKSQLFHKAAELRRKDSQLQGVFLSGSSVPKVLPDGYQSRYLGKLGQLALILLFLGFFHLNVSSTAQAEALPEYRVKAAFLYNFANYTQWPDDIGNKFDICIHGEHFFGNELNQMQEKKINQRDISIKYTTQIEELGDCQMVFISHSSAFTIKTILDHLKDRPVLKITDNLNRLHEGVTINIVVVHGKIKFDVDLSAAKSSGLDLSSQLLRFAREVYK